MKVVVNVEKVKENIKSIKEQSKTEHFIMVAKGNAYGMGSDVCKQLQNDVDMFAVAYASEGLRLKSVGIYKPIICLMPTSLEDIKTCILNSFHLSIINKKHAKRVVQVAKLVGITPNVHIKVDCGMNRFGVKCRDDYIDVESYLKNNANIEGVFTHLPSNNNCQIKDDITNFFKIIGQCQYNTHISFKGDYSYAKNFTAIRSGMDVVGRYENCAIDVFASVINIVDVKKGETVGYDGEYKAQHDSIIGIIDMGYADMPIKNSNLAIKVLANGVFYDIIGVCMDVCFIDITDGYVKLFDQVEICFEKIYQNVVSIKQRM